MQHRAIKSLLVVTLFVCISTTLLWSALTGPAADQPREISAPQLFLGPGLGPNLMTPKVITSSDNSSDISFDALIENVETELTDMSGTTATRRYMSALIAGEGCKLYVDYGDGIWVPWENNNSNTMQNADTADRFGDALSDTNPFD